MFADICFHLLTGKIYTPAIEIIQWNTAVVLEDYFQLGPMTFQGNSGSMSSFPGVNIL